MEHSPIELGLLLNLHGIGSGGAGHAPPGEGEGRRWEMELEVFADFGNCYIDSQPGEVGAEFLAGLAACGDHSVAVGHLDEQCHHVGTLYDLEEVVISIVLEPAYLACCVKEGQSLLAAEGYNLLAVKPLVRCLKVSLVTKVDESLYAPEVIDPVGIKPLDAPPCLGWRKAAEEQDTAIGRKERLERMLFYGHGDDDVTDL